MLRRFGRLAVVRLLLDARADMLVVNAEGTSAIAIAQLGKGAHARPLPRLNQDGLGSPLHICTGTRRTPATSARNS